MKKDQQFITQIADQLPKSVPQGLTIGQFNMQPGGNNRPDVEAVLKTGEREVPIVIEVQNTGGTATLREAARQAKVYGSESGAVPFVAGRFFGERARQVAKEEGVGIIDLAGNFYLKQGDLYIEKIVDKNPFVQKSPLKNLFAPVSSRVARVLLANPSKTWLLGELSQEANVSLGQTHKVIDRMVEEEIIERNEEGKLSLKNIATLLEEWKKVYPSYQQQKFTFFSYRQGYMAILASVLEKSGNRPFALSFFSGADLVAPFIRGITRVQFYVQQFADIEQWKSTLELQEIESGGNVELYVPYDEGVFYKKQMISSPAVGEVPIVSNIQLYMDLFSNPARGAEQAEHLREIKLKF